MNRIEDKLLGELDEVKAERDKLRSLNAEMLKALKLLVYGVENAMAPQINGGLHLAKSAITKAEGEE